MTRLPKIFWIICGVLFAAASIAIQYQVKVVMHQRGAGSVDTLGNLKVGQPAPDFTLQDLAGHPVMLSADQGRAVVLMDFWATWCGPCLERLPHVQALADDPALGSKGLVVIAIDERENAGDVRAFLAAHPADLTIALDRWGDVAGRYHVSGLPATFVIGRDGKIAAAIGAEAGDADRQLRQAVDAALQ